MPKLSEPSPLLLAVWQAEDVPKANWTELGEPSTQPHRWAALSRPSDAGPEWVRQLFAEGVPGCLALQFDEADSDRALAALRNRLWPRLHVTALYRVQDGRLMRRSVPGESPVEGVACEASTGMVLVAYPLQQVLSQKTTQVKFDKNAKSWDGNPGGANYAHFRWMRKLVGLYARPHDPQRILDFGCGAGWVGIEAARTAPAAALAFFDPSPEMVRIAEENAAEQGIKTFEGRVGFGESPPFPKTGESRFDWVISSGVISFSPDPNAWLDGLAKTVTPGGTLVVGDIHGGSLGFRKRRGTHPLLPTRELNAQDPAWVRKELESRGFRFVERSGYQATYPVPQLMHLGEKSVGKLLTLPLLWLNRSSAWVLRKMGGALPSVFDSWVMSFRAPS